MNAGRLAIDPLWNCLCPSWTSGTARTIARLATRNKRPTLLCLRTPPSSRHKSDAEIRRYEQMPSKIIDRGQAVLNPLAKSVPYQPPVRKLPQNKKLLDEDRTTSIDWTNEPTQYVYNHMRGLAIDGKWKLCRYLAEMLVRERGEKPSTQLYNMLVLSNVGHEEGAAWRVADLLEDMEKDGLQPDGGTCHAALKALAVHVDHLLRTDILDYMSKRWIALSEDGAHDVAAGLFREGLFEQALGRLDTMRRENMHVQGWLLDMAVYVLCEASEIGEAHRIMRQRVDSGELNISRSLWAFFLDKASDARHHAATSLVWSSQVEQHYVNPPSGVCLNVLATAARAADAALATDVFTHLSKRRAAFQPIHYELLIETYLAADPPDLSRSLAILTIMPLEKLEPTPSETRTLYMYMRDKPDTLPQAIAVFRDLHGQGRKIPIAALNLLIECYVEQGNLTDAMKLYKQIHTFAPVSEGAKKSFANIDSFNLLLKGCRKAEPPDEQQASFLVSELLALRVTPTALTYDRLILLFLMAGVNKVRKAARSDPSDTSEKMKANGLELLEWSFRHFSEMRPLGMMPRLGTLERLSVGLAEVGDGRCWDVLQAAEDGAESVSGWEMKRGHVRRNVEEAWEVATGDGRAPGSVEPDREANGGGGVSAVAA